MKIISWSLIAKVEKRFPEDHDEVNLTVEFADDPVLGNLIEKKLEKLEEQL